MAWRDLNGPDSPDWTRPVLTRPHWSRPVSTRPDQIRPDQTRQGCTSLTIVTCTVKDILRMMWLRCRIRPIARFPHKWHGPFILFSLGFLDREVIGSKEWLQASTPLPGCHMGLPGSFPSYHPWSCDNRTQARGYWLNLAIDSWETPGIFWRQTGLCQLPTAWRRLNNAR